MWGRSPLCMLLGLKEEKKLPLPWSGSGGLAERLGFEPRVRYQRTHDFQSCALDHSAISMLFVP